VVAFITVHHRLSPVSDFLSDLFPEKKDQPVMNGDER
jgi:hypothetical protein